MVALDPAVAPTENLLSAVSKPRDANDLLANPAQAEHAMWLCCCYQDEDAPTWLLFQTPDGGLSWCRLPDGTNENELIRARQWSGGHTDVAGVLHWIRGSAPDPWIDDQDRRRAATDLRIFTQLVRTSL